MIIEDLEEKQEVKKCQSCEKNDGTEELHICPFAFEINGDDSLFCNCCAECEHQCAMDI